MRMQLALVFHNQYHISVVKKQLCGLLGIDFDKIVLPNFSYKQMGPCIFIKKVLLPYATKCGYEEEETISGLKNCYEILQLQIEYLSEKTKFTSPAIKQYEKKGVQLLTEYAALLIGNPDFMNVLCTDFGMLLEEVKTALSSHYSVAGDKFVNTLETVTLMDAQLFRCAVNTIKLSCGWVISFHNFRNYCVWVNALLSGRPCDNIIDTDTIPMSEVFRIMFTYEEVMMRLFPIDDIYSLGSAWSGILNQKCSVPTGMYKSSRGKPRMAADHVGQRLFGVKSDNKRIIFHYTSLVRGHVRGKMQAYAKACPIVRGVDESGNYSVILHDGRRKPPTTYMLSGLCDVLFRKSNYEKLYSMSVLDTDSLENDASCFVFNHVNIFDSESNLKRMEARKSNDVLEATCKRINDLLSDSVPMLLLNGGNCNKYPSEYQTVSSTYGGGASETFQTSVQRTPNFSNPETGFRKFPEINEDDYELNQIILQTTVEDFLTWSWTELTSSGLLED